MTKRTWVKKGLIYVPDGSLPWACHSALTPTPILLTQDVIRVYAGFRDGEGVSRIGYVDVAAEQPSRVLKVSEIPALDIGEPGAFDDNGVILGDLISVGRELFMFYVGFQLVQRVKFLAFTGLAVSRDQGNTFKRLQRTPILDRSDEGMFIRAIHTARFEDGCWKIWYSAGSGWAFIDGQPYPRYEIRYGKSKDGLQFAPEGHLCIGCRGEEYRIGRPRVSVHRNSYIMYYTKGTLSGEYLPGYAESEDGMVWERKDCDVGIGLAETGWDSVSVCYPTLLSWGDKTYMFYNGNNMGRTGFGYAELVG